MNEELLYAYQQQLVFAGLDDFTGVGVLGAYMGGQYGGTSSLWRQAAVDFLYRNLVSGLITVAPSSVLPQINTNEGLIRLFADNIPNGIGGTTVSCWDYIFFDGTPNLDKILEEHNIHNWSQFHAPFNAIFMGEIENLYQQFDLSLEKKTVIPILINS